MKHPADFSKCVFFMKHDCICGRTHAAYLANKAAKESK